MGNKRKITKFFIHSCYVKLSDGDAVIVKEQIENEDGSFTPNLKVYKNPTRSFYVTKPRYRTHKYKLELADIKTLDRYVTHQYELPQAIAKVLGIHKRKPLLRDLCANPYIYGADISLEALIKMRYVDSYHNGKVPNITYGFLDIETSVINGEIILISFVTCNGDVFTAIRKDHMWKVDDQGNRIRLTLEETKEHVIKVLEKRLNEYAEEKFKKFKKLNPNNTEKVIDDFKTKLNYHFTVHDKSIDLIIETFKNIHREKMDFIGIWNMNFDIPRILETIKDSKYSYESILADPNLPKEFKKVYYREDKSRVSHFTLKWHWLTTTAHSQFVDSMSLFSQCRKTLGFRGKYTLDSILNEEIQIGKLSLGPEQSHFIMQTKRFVDYIAYNIFDVVGLLLLENQNHDIFTMYSLSDVTPVASFPRQTVKSTNTFYHKYIKKGKVISSASSKDPYLKFNKLFKNAGGAVLDPFRTSDIGIHILVS